MVTPQIVSYCHRRRAARLNCRLVLHSSSARPCAATRLSSGLRERESSPLSSLTPSQSRSLLHFFAVCPLTPMKRCLSSRSSCSPQPRTTPRNPGERTPRFRSSDWPAGKEGAALDASRRVTGRGRTRTTGGSHEARACSIFAHRETASALQNGEAAAAADVSPFKPAVAPARCSLPLKR